MGIWHRIFKANNYVLSVELIKEFSGERYYKYIYMTFEKDHVKFTESEPLYLPSDDETFVLEEGERSSYKLSNETMLEIFRRIQWN